MKPSAAGGDDRSPPPEGRAGSAPGQVVARYSDFVAGARFDRAEQPESLPSPRAFLSAEVAASQHRSVYRSVDWWCFAAAEALKGWRVTNHEHNAALIEFLDPSRRSRPLQDLLPEVLTVLGAEMYALNERRELLAAADQAKRDDDTGRYKQLRSWARTHKSELVEALWDVDDVVPTVGEFVDTHSPRLWKATRDQAWRALNRNRVAVKQRADRHDEDGDAAAKGRPPKGFIDATVLVEAINEERSDAESWARLTFANDHSETLAVLLRHGADCVYRYVPSPVVGRHLWTADMEGIPQQRPYWQNKANIRLDVFVCATAWASAIENGTWAREFDERVRNYLTNQKSNGRDEVTADIQERARFKIFKFVIHEVVKPELARFHPEWDTGNLDKQTGRYSFHLTYLLSQLCAETPGMEQTAVELERLLVLWRSGGGDD